MAGKHPRPKFHTEFKILDSTWVESLRFDPETFVLDVTLQNGSRYRYRDVPSWDFAHVVTAKSAGQAFNTIIKPRSHTKLPNNA